MVLVELYRLVVLDGLVVQSLARGRGRACVRSSVHYSFNLALTSSLLRLTLKQLLGYLMLIFTSHTLLKSFCGLARQA